MKKKKEPMYKLMDIWLTQKQTGKLLQYANERDMTVNHWLMETIGQRISDIELGIDFDYRKDKISPLEKYKNDIPKEFGGMGEMF